MRTTTKRDYKGRRYANAVAGQRMCLEQAWRHEAAGEMEEARMCAELAFKYQMEARQYEE